MITTQDILQRIEDELATTNYPSEPEGLYILPGGHPSAAQCHICRAVCRRAERHVVACCRTDLVPYLNRLSDFFFALALKLNIFYNRP